MAADRRSRAWPRSSSSAAACCWILDPPAPGWWPLPECWWLPGGLWTGVTQVASAIFALGLIVYGYRRFHDNPEQIDELDEQIERADDRRTDPDCRTAVAMGYRSGVSGDWRSGSALRSHRRGHWFEPSIAHRAENRL